MKHYDSFFSESVDFSVINPKHFYFEFHYKFKPHLEFSIEILDLFYCRIIESKYCMCYPLIMVFIHEGLKYFTRYCVQILAGSRIFMVNVLFEKMVGFMEVLLF